MNNNKRRHRKKARKLHQSITDHLAHRDSLSRDKDVYIAYIEKTYDMKALRPLHVGYIIDGSSLKEIGYLIEKYPILSGLIQEQYNSLKK